MRHTELIHWGRSLHGRSIISLIIAALAAFVVPVAVGKGSSRESTYTPLILVSGLLTLFTIVDAVFRAVIDVMPSSLTESCSAGTHIISTRFKNVSRRMNVHTRWAWIKIILYIRQVTAFGSALIVLVLAIWEPMAAWATATLYVIGILLLLVGGIQRSILARSPAVIAAMMWKAAGVAGFNDMTEIALTRIANTPSLTDRQHLAVAYRTIAAQWLALDAGSTPVHITPIGAEANIPVSGAALRAFTKGSDGQATVDRLAQLLPQANVKELLIVDTAADGGSIFDPTTSIA
jgi:hypothetical protein